MDPQQPFAKNFFVKIPQLPIESFWICHYATISQLSQEGFVQIYSCTQYLLLWKILSCNRELVSLLRLFLI